MANISARQQQILNFIRDYQREHSFAPSVRDIQGGCSISSTSVVDYNLRILQREGYVRRTADVSRGLELIGDAPSAIAEAGIAVPVLGYIAAGSPLPIPTDEVEPSEVIVLPPELSPHRAAHLYALRVRGLSMIDALIDDGDLVVLSWPSEIRDGDMVAAWLKVEQEATLKRIYRHGDQVRLQPANSLMEPILVPADNVEVQGKVVAVLRNLQ
jgi:repressor LexA